MEVQTTKTLKKRILGQLVWEPHLNAHSLTWHLQRRRPWPTSRNQLIDRWIWGVIWGGRLAQLSKWNQNSFVLTLLTIPTIIIIIIMYFLAICCWIPIADPSHLTYNMYLDVSLNRKTVQIHCKPQPLARRLESRFSPWHHKRSFSRKRIGRRSVICDPPSR